MSDLREHVYHGGHRKNTTVVNKLGHYNAPAVRRLGHYNSTPKKLGHYNGVATGKTMIGMEVYPHY
jgi:hypothetical protein